MNHAGQTYGNQQKRAVIADIHQAVADNTHTQQNKKLIPIQTEGNTANP